MVGIENGYHQYAADVVDHSKGGEKNLQTHRYPVTKHRQNAQ